MSNNRQRIVMVTLVVGLGLLAVASLFGASRALVTTTAATTVTLTAQKDTWINEGLPTCNQGNAVADPLPRAGNTRPRHAFRTRLCM